MRDLGDLQAARLHVVTGKGGTGKTTIACALALVLARQGGRVLLAEVEGRQGLAQAFDVEPLGDEERVLAVTPEGGQVVGLSVEPEQALLDYLEKFYNLRRAGSALKRLGAVDFATTIAPGLRDVLLTGKVSEAVRRTIDGRAAFSHVVLDGPPTGRIGRFLNVTEEVAGIARVGPIRAQADLVIGVVKNERTLVHVVSTLEEMPVQETADALVELDGLGLHVGAVVVSMPRTEHLDATAIDRLLADHVVDRAEAAAVTGALQRAGLPRSVPVDLLAPGLIDEGRDHAERILLEQEQWDRLDALGRPMLMAPHQPQGIDAATLRSLADDLAAQAGLA